MRSRPTALLTSVLLALAACSDIPPTAIQLAQTPASLDYVSEFGHGAQIVINELMPNPDQKPDDQGEWFEVHNWGDEAADLQGWTIASNNDRGVVIDAPVTVRPGGYVVFVRAAELLPNGKPKNDGRLKPAYVYGSSVQLANKSDWLALRSPNGVTVDSVAWSSIPTGKTRGVRDPSMPHADVNGDNWADATSHYGTNASDGLDLGTPNHTNDGYISPVPPGPITRVVIDPAAMTLALGQGAPLLATAYDANGRAIPTDFSWTSSAEGVAPVDASGTVQGLAEGSATIRATAPTGAYAEATVSVERVSVVITEIMPNPRAVSDADGEWFELYNPGRRAIDLKGWTIGSNNDSPRTIDASVVVAPGGYVVLGNNADPSTNGGVAVAYAYGSMALNNSTTDALWIVDPTGVVMDSVIWGTSSPPNGSSRALPDPALDNLVLSGAGSNWITSSQTFGAGDHGTPGYANDDTPPVGEVTTVQVTPNSATVTLGSTYHFQASARDQFGAVVTTTYTWSSSNPTVASVTSDGTVTARAEGSATIRATAANGVSGEAAFYVAASSAVYRNHLEFGVPTDATPADDYRLDKPQYSLSYNSTRGEANWVSWNLNRTQFGDVPRCDCFAADPALPGSTYHVVTSDYTGSGYSRGHMVMSEERTATAADNEATFLMTNILPQQQDLNGGPWLDFEVYTNDLARVDNKELYIIAGGTYTTSPTTLNNAGKVAIPSTTWKIVVVMNSGQGLADVHSASDLRVIAVNMPNVTGIAADDWTKYQTTVDAIEAATGYDFLNLLPDSIEAVVESQR